MTPDQIVAEARSWIGTKHEHLGRHKGVAVDCAGLVIEVARAVGIAMPDTVDDYARTPDGQLLPLCAQYLEPIPRADARPGDVIAMRFANEPSHLALLTPYKGALAILHSYLPVGRVIEHRMPDAWHARIVAAFRFKELAS